MKEEFRSRKSGVFFKNSGAGATISPPLILTSVLLLALIVTAFSFARPGYSQEINLGVDYLFEKYRQTEEGPQNRFTQVYDVILSRSPFDLSMISNSSFSSDLNRDLRRKTVTGCRICHHYFFTLETRLWDWILDIARTAFVKKT